MSKVYGAAAASRRTKLKWLAKARSARKRRSSCRKLLGAPSRAVRVSSRTVVSPASSSFPSAPPSPGVRPPLSPSGYGFGEDDDGLVGTNPMRSWERWKRDAELRALQDRRRTLARRGQTISRRYYAPSRVRRSYTDDWAGAAPNPELSPYQRDMLYGAFPRHEDRVESLVRGSVFVKPTPRSREYFARPRTPFSEMERLGGRRGQVIDSILRLSGLRGSSEEAGYRSFLGTLYDSELESTLSNLARKRQRRRNPELLVVSNPGRSRRRAAVTFTVQRHTARRNGSMRRRRKNSPLTVRVGGKRHTWKALTRKYGVKKAARVWRKTKKLHGYAGRKVSRNRRRRSYRRRARNSWHGHRRAHAKAARKGWKRRKYGKRRGRKGGRARKGSIKYGKKYYSRAALRRKLGKRKLAKLLKRRGRRN